MSDLVSRQQAIDALRNYLVGKNISCDGTMMARLIENEVINKLPSAHGTNLAEVGTDCISRQAAIDALRTCYDTETITMDNGDEYINYGDAVGEIEQLPPIQPKMGKWVLVCDNNGMHFVCNQCGAWRYHQEQNFCGECGADMRGEQDDG